MADNSVSEGQKKCRKCGLIKSVDEFGFESPKLRKNGEVKYYRLARCKSCLNRYQNEYRAERRKDVSANPLCACGCGEHVKAYRRFLHGHASRLQGWQEKQCTSCGALKQRDQFPGDTGRPSRVCADCHNRRAVKRELIPQLCACGCGEEIPRNKAILFKHGHQKERKCLKCGEVKSADQFSMGGWRTRANGERRRYLNPCCKPCLNEIKRSQPGIKAVKAAYQRNYSKTSQGKINKRRDRQKHQDHYNDKSRRWIENNPEKRRLIALACSHKRRTEQGWDKKAPEVRAAIEQTLELARIGDKYLDAYSGELIEEPTIDHIVPLSKGGTNDLDNLCVTSLSNNSSKFNDDLLVWLVKRAQTSHAF